MDINLGLVCMLTTTKFKKGFKGLKSLQESAEVNKKLKEASLHNIKETINCINWCINNEIYLYRISSDIIPFYEFWSWKEEKEITIGLEK